MYSPEALQMEHPMNWGELWWRWRYWGLKFSAGADYCRNRASRPPRAIRFIIHPIMCLLSNRFAQLPPPAAFRLGPNVAQGSEGISKVRGGSGNGNDNELFWGLKKCGQGICKSTNSCKSENLYSFPFLQGASRNLFPRDTNCYNKRYAIRLHFREWIKVEYFMLDMRVGR